MKKIRIIAFILVVAMACMALAACMPSNPDKAYKKLKDDGYDFSSVAANTLSIALKVLVDGVDSVIIANDGDDHITMIYFYDADQAKNAYAKVEEYVKDEEGEAVVHQDGNVIYYGTEDAIKDVKALF